MEDPFANEASKHFEKFTKFATQFTKAFVPIVDTAITSMEEPVSAFSVFQAAKESKKSKKQHKEKPAKEQNGHSQIQIGKAKPSKNNSKKPAVKKEVPASKSKHAKEAIPNNPVKNKTHKKATNKSRTGKTKDAEVLNLVDQLLGTAPPKKLSKTEQKKKQELENYLAKQLERDEEDPEDDYDSEDDSQHYSDSDEFSDEYTINESGSFNEEDSQVEEEESYEDSEEAEVLPITNKATRKRKSPEPDSVSKKKSIVAEPKKSKKIEEPTRKSLPNTKNEKVEESKRRKSLASIDDTKGKQMRKVSVTSVDVKLEPLSPPHNVGKVSSIDEGKRAFQWLLNPVSVNDFFAKYWEAKACLIKRKQSNYFSHLISFEAIDEMLIKNHVEFTKNLDVTSYKNGKFHLIYLSKNTIIINLLFF